MKNLIKLILALLISLGTIKAAALKVGDFKVILQENGDHLLFKKDLDDVFIRLTTTGTNFNLKNVFTRKETPNLLFIEYRSMTVGTSAIIDLNRAAVFNKKENRFLGDIPSSKVFKDNRIPYTWKIKKGKITVFDNKKVIKVLSIK